MASPCDMVPGCYRPAMMRNLSILSLASVFALSACRSPEPDESSRRENNHAQDQGGNAGAETPSAPTPTPPPPVAQPATPPAADGVRNPALLDPSLANERAPDTYSVQLDTTAGPVVIDVTRAWAPNGADRFYNLVKIGALNDVAFFRVLPGFMAQVGLNGDPAVNAAWSDANIQDDPVTQSNTRGMVTFAKTGMPNSRVQQFFINFADNSRLDSMGFAPFGRVRDMASVDRINSESGERPDQGRITSQGNAYLRQAFPNLDYIRSASLAQ